MLSESQQTVCSALNFPREQIVPRTVKVSLCQQGTVVPVTYFTIESLRIYLDENFMRVLLSRPCNLRIARLEILRNPSDCLWTFSSAYNVRKSVRRYIIINLFDHVAVARELPHLESRPTSSGALRILLQLPAEVHFK